jgi:hypothetical protein
VRLAHEAARLAGTGVHPIQFEVERLADTSQSSATVREKSTFMVPR